MNHLPNLYILRFVLALFVVFLHLRVLSEAFELPFYTDVDVFYTGLIAVYYFFTLSGFLIIRLIYTQIECDGKFSVLKFYRRRMRRLYPVYYLVMAIGIAVYHVVYPMLDIRTNFDYRISDLVAHYIFFVPNIFTEINPDTGLILYVLWSIGVEEQFYLAIPWLMIFFKQKILLLLTILLGLAIIGILFYEPFYKYNNFYFYFIAGGLISIINVTRKFKIFNSIFLHFVVYLLFFITFFTHLFRFDQFASFHLFHLVTSTMLVSLLADYPIFIIKNRLLTYLGRISYGIYMYHPIVITGWILVVQHTGIPYFISNGAYILIFTVCAILLTLFIAHLSHRYYETLFYKPRDHSEII